MNSAAAPAKTPGFFEGITNMLSPKKNAPSTMPLATAPRPVQPSIPSVSGGGRRRSRRSKKTRRVKKSKKTRRVKKSKKTRRS